MAKQWRKRLRRQIIKSSSYSPNSPLEVKFWQFVVEKMPGVFVKQLKFGPYTLDFAIPDRRVAIEIDGHSFHSTRAQREHDAQRDRYFLKHGWITIRFTGREINRSVPRCVTEVIEIVNCIRQV